MSRQNGLRLATFLFTIALISAGCTSGNPTAQPTTSVWTDTATPGPPSAFQQTVDALRSLQPRGAPSNPRDVTRSDLDFDINQYFTVLRHLNMQPGYTLDYVYRYDSSGASPIIYARRADQEQLATYEDYRAATGVSTASERIYGDGTPEAYFEWVVFQIMGGQFYLFWHAAYDDALVICDHSGLDARMAWGTGISAFSAAMIAEAHNIDFTPTIQIQGTQVVVRVVTFTQWGGFIERTYTLSRDPPLSIINHAERVLLKNDVAITY